ncbi:MAG TPA: lipid-A-disaccharide synthase [Hydrogenispora sp.]|nr:lipid-A-disaccharide synthase [Hydrogenispora sp.]
MKYFISAGEHSGDLHAASLIQEIRKQDPKAQIWGMGGPLMAAAGAEIMFDPTAESTIGFWEAAKKVWVFRRRLSEFTYFLRENRPDVVVWVDFGGFNRLLAEQAAALSIPVVCLFPPAAWAYGKGRADRLARCVTHVASVLPFEAEYYRRYYNLKVTYVGHPLVDRVRPQLAPEEWRQRHGLAPTEKVILLMPGSRKQEVRNLLPVMLAAAAELAASREDLRFFLPVAPTIDQALVQSLLEQHPGLAVETEPSAENYNLMAAADLGILASGTATLEAALLGLPMIVTYRVSSVSALLYRFLQNKENNQPVMVSLPNLIKGRKIVPELLQDGLTVDDLVMQVRLFLELPERSRQMRKELQGIGEILGPPGVMERVATIVRGEATQHPG